MLTKLIISLMLIVSLASCAFNSDNPCEVYKKIGSYDINASSTELIEIGLQHFSSVGFDIPKDKVKLVKRGSVFRLAVNNDFLLNLQGETSSYVFCTTSNDDAHQKRCVGDLIFEDGVIKKRYLNPC